MSSIPPRGSIPQNVRVKGEQKRRQQMGLERIEQRYKVKQYMPQYKRIHTKTLERLLSDAEELHAKMLGAIKIDPNNANLERQSELQRVITQLKIQISERR